MSLKQRNGIWHWRKMVDGVPLARSTGTRDEALAKKLAAKWDHEAVQQIRVEGVRPILLHDAIEGFLKERRGSGGYGSACHHMKLWKTLRNKLVKEIELHEVKEIVVKQKAEGYAHNTLAVSVMYWNRSDLMRHFRRPIPSPVRKSVSCILQSDDLVVLLLQHCSA
jgi:hypothetical protein